MSFFHKHSCYVKAPSMTLLRGGQGQAMTVWMSTHYVGNFDRLLGMMNIDFVPVGWWSVKAYLVSMHQPITNIHTGGPLRMPMVHMPPILRHAL